MTDFLQQGHTPSNKAIPPNSATPYESAFNAVSLWGGHSCSNHHKQYQMSSSARRQYRSSQGAFPHRNTNSNYLHGEIPPQETPGRIGVTGLHTFSHPNPREHSWEKFLPLGKGYNVSRESSLHVDTEPVSVNAGLVPTS